MGTAKHEWKFFSHDGLRQVKIACGADLKNLKNLDQKLWTVLAASNSGLRFDSRTLAFLDSDGDGRVRVSDLLAAIEFLESKDIDLDSLFRKDPEDVRRLADISEKLADLAKVEPSDGEKAAMAAWEKQPSEDPAILPLKDATGEANCALAAVEPLLDAFFAPADDAPLVMDGPMATLPFAGNINPRYADAIAAFNDKVVKPLLGDADELARAGYLKLKAAFAPYRAWVSSKPVMNAGAKGEIEEEERIVRYRMYLVEYIRNFVNQACLYGDGTEPMFLTGTLFIDGRECRLCFHVDNEAMHCALAAKSDCCIIYLKLVRAGAAARSACAVVTAGRTIPLYVGRNGIFYDRDGNVWDATITKVVLAQVSLCEAFWAPWRKIGELIGGQVKKFVGDTQAKSAGGVAKAIDGVGANAAKPAACAPAADQSANGAALASSIAALGIGVGMVGAAFAGIVGTVAGLPWWKTAIGVLLVIAAVSLPSVILAWFKLRRRDLGAVLNAGGWAVNRPLRFSQDLARRFTRKV